MHTKRCLCTTRYAPDVAGVISHLNERLRTPQRSQSGEAWAVEGPHDVIMTASDRRRLVTWWKYGDLEVVEKVLNRD
jgi:hypothetical protein